MRFSEGPCENKHAFQTTSSSEISYEFNLLQYCLGVANL